MPLPRIRLDTIIPLSAMRPVLGTIVLALSALPAVAQQRPPVRPLGPVVARSTDTIATIAGVRHLPDGRVLVNDVGRRRVTLLDSSLAPIAVVADSTAATANAYGGRLGGLLAFRGDSSLFVDPASMSMLVIDPAGKVARVMSVPRTQDAMALANPFSPAGFDPAGRLVYRAGLGGRMGGMGAGGQRVTVGAAGAAPRMPELPDTNAIVRVDLATRTVDTVGFIRIARPRMTTVSDSGGRTIMMSEINPLPVVDDWTVLPDGSVAFVRGRDYHVDFVNADGSRMSAPKVPFEWQRMSDEDKVTFMNTFMDSVKAARERQAVATAAGHGAAGDRQVMAGGGAGGGAVVSQTIVMSEGGPGGARGGAMGFTPPPPSFIPASELPDYKPAFFANSVRADAEGNLWIRTIPTRQVPGGPVYDVLDRKGELVDRVQVPAGRAIVGFGNGGTVYLLARDASGLALERARVR